MTTNTATLQHANGFNLSSPLGDPTVPAPLPLPPLEPPPLVPGVFVSGAGHLFQAVTALQHFVFLAVSVTGVASWAVSYSVHPVMQVMLAFNAKHDNLGMQHAAWDFTESSLPGLKTWVAGQLKFTPFNPHVFVSDSQHVASTHEAAFEAQLSPAFAATAFKPFFFVPHE